MTSDHLPGSVDLSSSGKPVQTLEKGGISALMDEHRTMTNLDSEVHRIQEFHWQNDLDGEFHSSRLLLNKNRYIWIFFSERSNSQQKRATAQQQQQASFSSFLEEEDEPSAAFGTHSRVNSKSFMPLGMLALRAANARTSAGPETLLGRGLREAAQAIDRAMLETRSRYSRFPDAQLKDLFVPHCLLERTKPAVAQQWLDNEVRANVSRALSARLREHSSRVSQDKAEFHLLNLQGLLLPGNKTQLRFVYSDFYQFFLIEIYLANRSNIVEKKIGDRNVKIFEEAFFADFAFSTSQAYNK